VFEFAEFRTDETPMLPTRKKSTRHAGEARMPRLLFRRFDFSTFRRIDVSTFDYSSQPHDTDDPGGSVVQSMPNNPVDTPFT